MKVMVKSETFDDAMVHENENAFQKLVGEIDSQVKRELGEDATWSEFRSSSQSEEQTELIVW